MVGWIVLGVCVLAVLVLVGAVVPVLRRLRAMGEAMRGLQRRAADAQQLVPAVEALQARAEAMQRQLATLEERSALVKARRGSGEH
jgi:biopolymer transport protein ExbB/TolQ